MERTFTTGRDGRTRPRSILQGGHPERTGACDAAVTGGSLDPGRGRPASGDPLPASSTTREARPMTTLATYVEMPTPRREMAAGDESLPAELKVAFGAAEAPVAGSVPLHDFLATAGPLTHAERMVLVEQALLLLEGNYVHLPLKSAMHAVNPVQRLRLLRARLMRQTHGDDGSRADLPRGDVGDLPLGARPAHQLPAAGAVRRDDRLPAVPGGELQRRRRRDSTWSPGSPQGMSAPAVRRRRRGHALERHADRARGRASTPTGSPAATWPPGWPAASTR